MVYLIYKDLMDQIRDGSVKQLTVAIRPEQTLSTGDEVTFESIASKKPGADPASGSEEEGFSVTLVTAREVGEKRGYKLWHISWE